MVSEVTRGIWRDLRHHLAAAFLDTPFYELMLRGGGAMALGRSWVDLHNRGERLVRRAEQRGVSCDWRWTSPLYFCLERPAIGRRLLSRALADWPVEFADAPHSAPSAAPDLSFIIGHRGIDRQRHLVTTIASIAAQEDVSLECLVVEQDLRPTLGGVLPPWVRHVHTPPPRPDLPYSRSWAFNVGARAAHGRYLVFHDNDVCMPVRYGAELMRIFHEGFEAARLQRFVFYLGPEHSASILSTHSAVAAMAPLRIEQNCEGHTLGVQRDAYWEVGGHDEGFLGWGGEDNEILERLRVRRIHDHAYLPFLHLHHPPQPGKAAHHPNSAYFAKRMALPPGQRAAELARREQGRLGGPALPQEVDSLPHA